MQLITAASGKAMRTGTPAVFNSAIPNRCFRAAELGRLLHARTGRSITSRHGTAGKLQLTQPAPPGV